MSDPNVEIPKWYQPKFTQDVRLLSQQTEAKLRQAVTVGTYQGESGEAVKQMGIVEALVGDEGGTTTPNVSAPRDQRWVFPTLTEIGKTFKRSDALRILTDQVAPEKMAFVAGMNRAEDKKIILPAFFGPAKTGKAGGTTTNFPATSQDVAQTVGSADGVTNVGINTAKLIKGRRRLRGNNVDIDTDPMWCLLSADEEEQLLNDIKVTNRDYNGQNPILIDGKLTRWLNFNFIILDETIINPADATERWTPLWAQSGMHLGLWNELGAYYAQDPSQKFNYRLYLEQEKGSTRLEEAKVVRIRNKVQS